jgi:glycosyltransferase involved in cell wall biosynthesis
VTGEPGGPLRVGYLADADPLDRFTWSGSHFYGYRALEAEGLDVTHVGKSLLEKVSPARRLARRVVRRLGLVRPAPPEDPLPLARRRAEAAARELEAEPVDVLFAPVASSMAAFLETPIPIVYESDATFRLMRGYYASVSALPDAIAAQYEELEARTLRRCRAAIYPSRWAADSAVRDYGMAPESVHVVPLGAALDELPSREEAISHPREGTLRLLFIGRDWERKGGGIALDALSALRRQGIVAELTVVGTELPAGLPREGVTVFRLLDKNVPADRATLRRLLLSAHFFVLPTRADCFSLVSCEAAAHGLPALVTRTGGIPGVIEEGRNGFLLEPEAGGEEWAAKVAATWADPSRYEALVRSSRDAWEERLNWGAWARSVSAILANAAGKNERGPS